MAVGIIKKIIPKVIKKAPKKKVKVPLKVKKGPRADKTDDFGSPLSEKGSPYQTVDELAAPLHRRQRYYPVGTEKKKLKKGKAGVKNLRMLELNKRKLKNFIKLLEKINGDQLKCGKNQVVNLLECL